MGYRSPWRSGVILTLAAVRSRGRESAAFAKDRDPAMTKILNAPDADIYVVDVSFKALQDYQAKLLHLVQENATANMHFAQQMMQPRSPSDFVEFMSTHLRERATAITDQAKELATLGQEAAKKAAEAFTAPKS